MYKIGSGKGLVIFVHFIALSKKFQCLKDPEDKTKIQTLVQEMEYEIH